MLVARRDQPDKESGALRPSTGISILHTGWSAVDGTHKQGDVEEVVARRDDLLNAPHGAWLGREKRCLIE